MTRLLHPPAARAAVVLLALLLAVPVPLAAQDSPPRPSPDAPRVPDPDRGGAEDPSPPAPLPIPGRGQGEEDDVPLSPLVRLREQRRTALVEGVLGAWQLESYSQDGIPVPEDEIDGVALFDVGEMALVVHSIGYDAANDEEARVAQAGIFRYRIDDFEALQTATVLAHVNPFGDVEYEDGGGLRSYELDVDGPFLTLRHAEGTVLRFSRFEESTLRLAEIVELMRSRREGNAGAALGGDGAAVDGSGGEGEEEAGEEDPGLPTAGQEDEEEDGDGFGGPAWRRAEGGEEGDLAPLLRLRRDRRAAVEQGIVGPWVLVGYERDGVRLDPGEITARALFADGYLALVIHAIGFDEANLEETALAQAGVYRYRIDEVGRLQTSTVIGHDNVYGEIDWDEVGELRQYDVTYTPPASSLADSTAPDALVPGGRAVGERASGDPGSRRGRGGALGSDRRETLELTADGTTLEFVRGSRGGLTQRELDRLHHLRGLGFEDDR